MFPVFESIKVLDGVVMHLDYHIARMQSTCKKLWGETKAIEPCVQEILNNKQNGLQKCKLMYDLNTHQIEWSSYQPKKVETLLLLEDHEISYPHKYCDRSVFLKAGKCMDENTEVIYCKNGLLTDSTYSNVAMWNGTEWHTPLEPLLLGTKRQYLLDTGLLKEHAIEVSQLNKYSKICLINAMLELGEIEIDMQRVSTCVL
jgi:4-amino-4-deoxychorismate lyase